MQLARTDTAKTLLRYHVVGPGSATKLFELTDAQLADWQRDFPNLDVLAECRKAGAWLRANPTKRKTLKGMPRFLVNWLLRATDSPRASVMPARKLTRNEESMAAARRIAAEWES